MKLCDLVGVRLEPATLSLALSDCAAKERATKKPQERLKRSPLPATNGGRWNGWCCYCLAPKASAFKITCEIPASSTTVYLQLAW